MIEVREVAVPVTQVVERDRRGGPEMHQHTCRNCDVVLALVPAGDCDIDRDHDFALCEFCAQREENAA